jgi:hypothetical protein
MQCQRCFEQTTFVVALENEEKKVRKYRQVQSCNPRENWRIKCKCGSVYKTDDYWKRKSGLPWLNKWLTQHVLRRCWTQHFKRAATELQIDNVVQLQISEFLLQIFCILFSLALDPCRLLVISQCSDLLVKSDGPGPSTTDKFPHHHQPRFQVWLCNIQSMNSLNVRRKIECVTGECNHLKLLTKCFDYIINCAEIV